MTKEQFDNLQAGTIVKSGAMTGKVVGKADSESGDAVHISIQWPLRRRGRRTTIKFENVSIITPNFTCCNLLGAMHKIYCPAVGAQRTWPEGVGVRR